MPGRTRCFSRNVGCVDLVWALVAFVFVVHAGYALWIARRLDRLHQRVDTAAAALDEQLRARAAAATAIGPLAAQALAIHGLGRDREQAESALSRAIAGIAPDPTLTAANARAGYARAFYNDTVRDVLVVRRRRIVRAFRLAGSARLPAFFEMDEAAAARRTIDV
ncbi:MAG: hypothetical protein QOC82_1798 [Frankiaceae bacterium]|nr:hypothetical protein [Frankiaceae bacterium]